jgi:hypothetical protein
LRSIESLPEELCEPKLIQPTLLSIIRERESLGKNPTETKPDWWKGWNSLPSDESTPTHFLLIQ